MYTFFLGLHNWARWAVLLLGVFALTRAYAGWLGKRPWTPADRKAGLFFGIAMDIQLLIGLLLYIIFSPITRAALADFGAAMGSRELAFFVVEHGLAMLAAVILVHIGSSFSRRADSDLTKHKAAAIWFTIAFLLMIVSIPWWRPLLRI